MTRTNVLTRIQDTAQSTPEYGFSLVRVFPYPVQEYGDQIKPVFWCILPSENDVDEELLHENPRLMSHGMTVLHLQRDFDCQN